MTSNDGLNTDKRIIGQLIVLLLLWAVAFYPVFPPLIKKWFTNSNYSYGVLVPFISGFFIMQQRKHLMRERILSSNWGLVLLLASLTIYWISYAGGVLVAMRIAMVASLLGIVFCTLGANLFRQFLFPLLFLFFMVPVPESIEMAVTFPLQLFATKTSTLILKALAIPVYREGNMLYFVGSQLEVAEACSGIRSITALGMLGILFSYLMPKGWKRKLLLVSSSVPIAMAANILRVSGTGILAHIFGDKVARGFLHEFSGIVVFFLGLLTLYVEFLILTRIRSAPQKQSDRIELVNNTKSAGKDKGLISSRAFGISAILLGFSIIIATLISGRGIPEVTDLNLDNIPMVIDGFVGEEDAYPQSVYDALQADGNIYRHYKSPEGEQVDLYIGYYGTAKGGRTGHNPYACLPGSGWGIISTGKVNIMLIDEKDDNKKKEVKINHVFAKQGEKYLNMYHWYEVRGEKVIHSGIQHNIERFAGRILSNRDDGAFVQINIYSDGKDVQGTQMLGKLFAEKILKLLPEYWPIEKVRIH